MIVDPTKSCKAAIIRTGVMNRIPFASEVVNQWDGCQRLWVSCGGCVVAGGCMVTGGYTTAGGARGRVFGAEVQPNLVDKFKFKF